MKKRSTTLLVGALACTALLAGCGDDKKSGGGTSDAKYCTMIKDFKAKADELGAVFDSSTPDPKSAKAAYTAAQGMLHELDKNPPSSIAADVHTVVQSIDQIVTIFEKYDWDFNKLATAPELTDLTTLMSGDKYITANEHMQTYSTETCGIPADS